MKKRCYTIALIGIVVFLVDLTLKFIIQKTLPPMTQFTYTYPYNGIGVFKDFFGVEFSIVHTINRGAAWGIFSNYQGFLLALRVVLVVGLIGYVLFFNKHKRLTLPLTLVIVGALGNILDYFFYGHVIDFIHFVFWGYDYPVFNIADSAICIGLFWILLDSFFYKPSQNE